MTVEHASSANSKGEQKLRATPASGDAAGRARGASARGDLVAARRELAELREQVAELDAQISLIRRQANHSAAIAAPSASRMITSIAATVLVGAIVRRLRLGLLGAAAAPLLAAQINQRLWPEPGTPI